MLALGGFGAMRLSLWVGLLGAACNGPEDDPQPALEDRDGDGWYGIDGGGDDCDDEDDRIFPHAPEPCDGVDNDCNNQIDDGATITLYADTDGDGFGTADNQVQGCGATDGWSEVDGDCDDGLATAFPGATEVCDHQDNDCDGGVDDLSPSTSATTARTQTATATATRTHPGPPAASPRSPATWTTRAIATTATRW
jgi:hypothetical protein